MFFTISTGVGFTNPPSTSLYLPNVTGEKTIGIEILALTAVIKSPFSITTIFPVWISVATAENGIVRSSNDLLPYNVYKNSVK